MKKIIGIASCLCFILLLIYDCNNQKVNQEKQKEQRRHLDSVAVEKKRSLTITDSIKRTQLQEMSLIAWGDTKFGMSRQEVKKSTTFRGGDFKEKLFFVSQDSTIIGGIKFSTISADFYNNALYRIIIRSSSHSTNDFDNLLKTVETLRSKIQSKYGKPSFTEKDTEYLASQLMDKKNVTLFKWKIGNKRIDITIMHNFDNYFYVEGVIYDNELVNKEIDQNKLDKQMDAGGF